MEGINLTTGFLYSPQSNAEVKNAPSWRSTSLSTGTTLPLRYGSFVFSVQWSGLEFLLTEPTEKVPHLRHA